MEYFKKYYADVNFDGGGEVKVLCPFHQDSKPSASINVEKSLFHCFVCGTGMSEVEFMKAINGVTTSEALEVISKMSHKNEWELGAKAKLWSNNAMLESLHKLGLSNSTIEELNLGLVDNCIGFPVFYNNALLDIRSYNISKIPNLPKVKSKSGAEGGLIIPFDVWVDSEELTYIYEGEKDMAIAREQGINAITLTGGAGAVLNEKMFSAVKDKEFVICYDNDKAGRDGAKKLAKQLKGLAKDVKRIDIGKFVKEEKEDFYDYITKYNGDVFEFLAEEPEEFKKDEIKVELNTIKEILDNNTLLKEYSVHVRVSADFSDVYSVPTYLEAEKVVETDNPKDELSLGDKVSHTINSYNLHNILELMEIDAKSKMMRGKYCNLLQINPKEEGINITTKSDICIYKSIIEDIKFDNTAVNLELYSLDKLINGKQYLIKLKIAKHPNKNQKVVALAHYVEEINSCDGFEVDKQLLTEFQIEGSVDDKVEYLFQSAKNHVAPHLNRKLWFMTDLVFNSSLNIPYRGAIKGALDVFVLGDTQVGKSEVSSKLVELYDFGTFLSLKTSTNVGLIGGSTKVNDSWCNTIGAIPRQHEGLVVMEEFSGADPSFIKTMTDVRSSCELRIARASGELRVPCKLRMLTISNPISDSMGTPRFLDTFPNAVMPITELIPSAEDISRYDAFVLVPKVKTMINPFELNESNAYTIPKQCYEHKAKWIKSRVKEDIEIPNSVASYIWEKGQALNDLFKCNFSLFGTTTDIKLARMSVALATLIVNTNEDMTKIEVTKEIVDYMYDFLVENYCDPLFNLNGYKKEYDSLTELSDADITALQRLYPTHNVLIDTISKTSKASRNVLRTVSGLDGDKFNIVFSELMRHKFVTLQGEQVIPTGKLYKGYNIIDKSFTTNGLSMRSNEEVKLT